MPDGKNMSPDLPYKTTKMPPPIPGTVYGSAQERWQKLRDQGLISDEVAGGTSTVDISPPGDPNTQSWQDIAREQEERANKAQNMADMLYDRESPIGKMLLNLEQGNIPDIIRDPEKKESLEELHEEVMRSLYDPFVSLARDARTRFVPQNWTMQHEGGSVKRIANTAKVKISVHRPFKPERVKGLDQVAVKMKEKLTRSEYEQQVFQSRVYADLTTAEAHEKIFEDGFGKMSVYFSGFDQIAINTRRLTVASTEDFRQGFSVKRDKVLRVFLAAQKDEAGSDPNKKIENAPHFFEEGYTDLVKQKTAEMVDLHNVIGEMNHRDPFAEGSQDMRIKVTLTEQEFIGSLFKRVERTDEHGHLEWTREDGTKVIKPEDQTAKIIIYFDRENNQIPVDENNRPIRKPDHHKEVYTHILQYENTVRSELEHKRWMSLLMAYTMTDARVRLQEICRNRPDILSIRDASDPHLKEFKDLILKVNNMANDLLEDWDSPFISMERQAASDAVELNHMIQIATVNIANLGHISHWDRVKDTSGNLMYKFVDEVGDPDMALDAVSAMLTMQHEWTYAKIKDRISTPLLPPVHPKFVEKVVNMAAHGGRDPELLAYAEKSEYIARGFGMIGMFEAQLSSNPHWREGKKQRDELGIKCNSEVIQVLEQTMFGVPTVFDGAVYPMPIVSFFRSQSLFDSMHVSKDRTLQDILNDRVLLTEVNWEQYHPFAEDGRAVVGRFTTDITRMMYGAADGKAVDAFFASPAEAIKKIKKAMDIGGRAEVKLFKFTDSKGNTSTKPINKKIYEITFASYLYNAYLSFYKYGLWDGNEKFKINVDPMVEGDLSQHIPGFSDVIEQASYLLETKQGFPNYRDSFIALSLGLNEFSKGIGVVADKTYDDRLVRKAINIAKAHI